MSSNAYERAERLRSRALSAHRNSATRPTANNCMDTAMEAMSPVESGAEREGPNCNSASITCAAIIATANSQMPLCCRVLRAVMLISALLFAFALGLMIEIRNETDQIKSASEPSSCAKSLVKETSIEGVIESSPVDVDEKPMVSRPGNFSGETLAQQLGVAQ